MLNVLVNMNFVFLFMLNELRVVGME